jgi:hypothetical protein
MAMTPAMREVVEAIRVLAPEEQDNLAMLIREELIANQRWEELFADPRSAVLLSELVAEALATPESELEEGW